MIPPDSSGHAWPWLLECKNPFYIVAFDFFARYRIDNGWLDAKER